MCVNIQNSINKESNEVMNSVLCDYRFTILKIK